MGEVINPSEALNTVPTVIKKIDVNSIYKVNRRIRLILTFKSSASLLIKSYLDYQEKSCM